MVTRPCMMDGTDHDSVCDHEFKVRVMRMNDGTESELRQPAYQALLVFMDELKIEMLLST